MPTVSIGNIDKRVNSTKQTFSSAFSADCKLKEPCSMEGPVFIVQGLSKGSLYNYAQFEGRYYWVDDIVYLTNNIQEVHCHIDPLATYKDDIKNTWAFVKYSSNQTHWDKGIDDIRLQPSIQINVDPIKKQMFKMPLDPTQGTVILRVMESATANAQGVKTYALTYHALQACLADLTGFMDGLTQSVGSTIMDLIQYLGKMWAAIGGQGSWRDNIVSCIFVPIKWTYYSDAFPIAGGMFLGSVPCGTNVGSEIVAINAPMYVETHDGDFAIPWTADQTAYPFLKNSRWTAIQIQTAAGFQDIDVTDIREQHDLHFASAIDVCSGDWSCKITEKTSAHTQVLGAFSGCCGMDISCMLGSAASFAQAFSVAAGKVARAALGDVTVVTKIGESTTVTGETLTETTDKEGNSKTVLAEGSTKTTPVYKTEGSGISGAMVPSGVTAGSASGSIGGGASNLFLFDSTGDAGSIILNMITYRPATFASYDDFCSVYGYPSNEFLQLSNTNYVQCYGASVNAIGATTRSLSQINSCLNGTGIFIE